MHRDGSPSELDDAREDAEDRQHLFRQQVAEALYASGNGPLFDGPVAHAVCTVLAPRVAAAIAVAGKVGLRSAEDGDRARAVALAALRGETP